MKKLIIIALALISTSLATRAQGSDAFDLYFNSAGAFQVGPLQGSPTGSFALRDLRIEALGNITPNFYYRFRQKLFGPQHSGSFDPLSLGTDFFMVGWRFAPRWKMEIGRFCQHWGGFEFDENPMYAYEQSDITRRLSIYTTGVCLTFEPWQGHEFLVEVSNSNNNSFGETYGDGLHLSDAAHTAVDAPRWPLTYILGWNGSFLDGKLLTRWATGFYHQTAQGHNSYVLYLGQKLNLDRVQLYFDFVLHKDGMDRIGIATEDFALPGIRVDNVLYTTQIAKFYWQFAPKWKLMLYGTSTQVNAAALGGAYRTHIGYNASLEFYPFKGHDFRFFLAGLGNTYIFNSNNPALQGRSDARIELGVMFRPKIL